MKKHRRADSPLSPLVLRLEEASGLDGAVEQARPIMDAVTAHDGVRSLLQGKHLGHALHPLLVQVPLGTFASATLLDLAGGSADTDGRAAQLLTAVGLVCSVPSALSGWAELAATGRREQRVGVAHAAANAVGILLQAAAWSQRRRGRWTAAAVCSMAGMTALGAAGYLGGHLAVARDVGSKDRVFAG